jgi:hypothetical protein
MAGGIVGEPQEGSPKTVLACCGKMTLVDWEGFRVNWASLQHEETNCIVYWG